MSNISKLLKEVEGYYAKEGRSHLPWRPPTLKLRAGKADPYRVLVAEMMLQQTQVDRVLPFYKNFLEQFPTVQALAKAPLSKVLKAWQGLGYNRRAKFLQQAAVVLSKEGYTGQKLPGVGPYTQGAIEVFALNKPSVIIETNIRTVFIYFCYGKPEKKLLSQKSSGLPSRVGPFAGQTFSQEHFPQVSDAEILPLVEKALAKTKLEPREFYAALMDYGSYLKKQGVKLNKQSKHYTKQSKFEGSARQLRGAILRELLKKPQTKIYLIKNLHRKAEEVDRELTRMQAEGFVQQRRGSYAIRT